MPSPTFSDPDIVCDAESHDITFRGVSGRMLLLAFTTKAKFGERFDTDMLLNARVGRLLNVLTASSPAQLHPKLGAGLFTPADLQDFADRIASAAKTLGWWSKSVEEKRAFLRDTMAAPHRLSDEQVETIIESVVDRMHYYERLVSEYRGAS